VYVLCFSCLLLLHHLVPSSILFAWHLFPLQLTALVACTLLVPAGVGEDPTAHSVLQYNTSQLAPHGRVLRAVVRAVVRVRHGVELRLKFGVLLLPLVHQLASASCWEQIHVVSAFALQKQLQ
jgi:hypothetical protein